MKLTKKYLVSIMLLRKVFLLPLVVVISFARAEENLDDLIAQASFGEKIEVKAPNSNIVRLFRIAR